MQLDIKTTLRQVFGLTTSILLVFVISCSVERQEDAQEDNLIYEYFETPCSSGNWLITDDYKSNRDNQFSQKLEGVLFLSYGFDMTESKANSHTDSLIRIGKIRRVKNKLYYSVGMDSTLNRNMGEIKLNFNKSSLQSLMVEFESQDTNLSCSIFKTMENKYGVPHNWLSENESLMVSWTGLMSNEKVSIIFEEYYSISEVQGLSIKKVEGFKAIYLLPFTHFEESQDSISMLRDLVKKDF